MIHLKTFERHINFANTEDTISTIEEIVKNSKLPPKRTPRIHSGRMYDNIFWLVYSFTFKTIQEKWDKSKDRKKFTDDLKDKLLKVEGVENVEIECHAYLEPLSMYSKYSGLHSKRTSIYAIKCYINEDVIGMSKEIDKYNL